MTKFFTSILVLLALIALASCNKPAGESGGSADASGNQGNAQAQPMDVPEQQQAKPSADQFKVDSKQMEERGSTTQLPASWPAEISLPEGAEITQAASRNGTDLAEFSVAAGLADVTAGTAADASAAGFSLREESVDRYSQTRTYTSSDRQYTSTVTEADGKCFGTLSISPLAESQTFSEATHYSGEFEQPASWPADILPVYPDCVLRELYVPLKQGGRLMLSAQSNADEDAVIAWLEAELPKHGWTLKQSQTRNGFSIRSFEGNGYSLSAAACGLDGLTDIQYEANSI